MSLYLISFISVLSFFILLLAFFLIRSIISPKKAASIEKYINAGKYATAIKRAKAIIAKNPRDTKAHYLLGQAYLADGRAELALMEFKTISKATFESKAQEKEFRNLTAQLYERFQQHTEALAEYALLIKLDPQNAEYHYAIGQLFEQLNKTEQAIFHYRQAINLNSKYAAAHAALGLILFRNKMMSEAKQEITTALKLEPDNTTALYYQGRLLRETKEYAPALAAFEKAARIRDGIQAVKTLRGRNSVDDMDPEARDYIGWASEGALITFTVFKMRGGRVVGRDVYRTESLKDEDEVLPEFLMAYYTESQHIPPHIFVPAQYGYELAEQWFAEQFGVTVTITMIPLEERPICADEAAEDEPVYGGAGGMTLQDNTQDAEQESAGSTAYQNMPRSVIRHHRAALAMATLISFNCFVTGVHTGGGVIGTKISDWSPLIVVRLIFILLVYKIRWFSCYCKLTVLRINLSAQHLRETHHKADLHSEFKLVIGYQHTHRDSQISHSSL